MAVYTEVTDEDLTGFLARYPLGRVLSLKGIAEGVQNSNFLLRTEGGEFILTLYESQVDVADLPFFLGLMAHLAAKGITCPQPVPMRAGDLSGTLAGRPAAIFTFLDGVWIRRPGVAHCAALGAALAGFHAAGADFAMTRRNALGPDDWRPLFLRSKARADEVVAGLADEISAELDELDRRFPRDLPTGVIHADLFPDNVFFLGDRLSGLIDFYFACTDAYAYDVAVCLNSWCFETDGSFNQTKGRAFLTAYEAVRPLSPAEAAALPILCRGSALRFLLTRLYDWLNVPPGALVRPKDPLEYLRKVRFHRAVSHAGDYGLTRPDARA